MLLLLKHVRVTFIRIGTSSIVCEREGERVAVGIHAIVVAVDVSYVWRRKGAEECKKGDK